MSVMQSPDQRRVASIIDGAAVIPRDTLAREADLMLTKWPAYRFLSPMQATDLFAEEYRAAYKRILHQASDVDHGKNAKPLEGLNSLTNNSAYTQVWIARQHADEFCVPYNIYLDFPFAFAAARERHTWPSPNQLRPKPDSDQETAWMAKFKAHWDVEHLRVELVRMPLMAQYARAADASLPAQAAFRELLLEVWQQTSARLDSLLGGFVRQRSYLTVEDCESAYGQEPVQRALELVAMDAELGLWPTMDHSPLGRTDLWQACIGTPGIDTETVSVCQECSQREECRKLQSIIERRLVQAHGTADPVKERKRTSNRERQRAYRAKQAALRATPEEPQEVRHA